MHWTAEQILKLAPDSSSAQASQGLVTMKKWSALGSDGATAWGECKGSGAKPYKTQIDLSEPAFRCSCPSRKFPCKHGLALFLLLVEQSSEFKQKKPPEWVTEWMKGRTTRAAKKEAKATEPTDPEVQVKTAAARLESAQEGAQELRVWLEDIIRTGIASLATKDAEFWQRTAARMVDAKAPGLARLVREMSVLPSSGSGWQDRMLAAAARTCLLLEGFARSDSLPEDVREDIRALIGWTQDQKALLEQGGVGDSWLVLGQRTELEDRLQVQRTWLHGSRTNRTALILTFAYGNQAPFSGLIPGPSFEGELVFMPGRSGLRALVKVRSEATQRFEGFPGESIAHQLSAWAEKLSEFPWLERFPLTLSAVVPGTIRDSWFLVDTAKKQVPLHPRFQEVWKLAALSGGHPIGVCGEWDGTALMPISAAQEGRLVEFGA